MLRNATRRADKGRRKVIDRVGRDANHPTIIGLPSQTALLRAAAPMITTIWLINVLDQALHPPVLQVQNAEGEQLLFCALHYPLAANVTLDDIRCVLNRCSEFRQEGPAFWNWHSSEKSITAAPQSNATPASHTFFTKLDDGTSKAAPSTFLKFLPIRS